MDKQPLTAGASKGKAPHQRIELSGRDPADVCLHDRGVKVLVRLNC